MVPSATVAASDMEHTMQAITTKYLGPTNTKESRIRVSSQAGSRTFSWKYETGVEENHVAAAMAYADFMSWNGEWVGGALPDGTGYAFVCTRVHSVLKFTVGA
jgi:hypothetical protein